MLVRVEAAHFVAGVEVDDDSLRCVRAAPILHWAIGLDRDALRGEFRHRGWRATVIRGTPHHPLLAVHHDGTGRAR